MFALTSTCRSGEGGALWFRARSIVTIGGTPTVSTDIVQTQWPTAVRKFKAWFKTIIGLHGQKYIGWGDPAPDPTNDVLIQAGIEGGPTAVPGVAMSVAQRLGVMIDKQLVAEAQAAVVRLGTRELLGGLSEQESLELALARKEAGIAVMDDVARIGDFDTRTREVPAVLNAMGNAQGALNTASDFWAVLRAKSMAARAMELARSYWRAQRERTVTAWLAQTQAEAETRATLEAEIYRRAVSEINTEFEVAGESLYGGRYSRAILAREAQIAQAVGLRPLPASGPAEAPLGPAEVPLGPAEAPRGPAGRGEQKSGTSAASSPGISATHRTPWPYPESCILGPADSDGVNYFVPTMSTDGMWDDQASAALLWLLCKINDGDAASRMAQWNAERGPMPSLLVRYVLWFASMVPPAAFNLTLYNPVVPDLHTKFLGLELPDGVILPLWGESLTENPSDEGWWAQSPVNAPLPNPPSMTGRMGTFRSWPVSADVLPAPGAAKDKGTAPAASSGSLIGTGVKAAIVYYGLKWLLGG